jgi:hypothetical protein
MLLVSLENTTTVLHPGKHQIHLVSGVEGPTCGLVPLGKKNQVHFSWSRIVSFHFRVLARAL